MPISRLTYRILMLVMALAVACPALAQAPSISFLTAADYPIIDGFKTVEPYDIETDSLGYAYFVGPFGLYRFNGLNMTEVHMDSALGTSAFRSLYKDGDLIWAHSFAQGFGYISRDSLITYPFRDSLERFNRNQIDDLHMDASGKLHLAIRDRGYFTVSPTGQVKEEVGRDHGLNGFVVTYLDDGTPFHFFTLTSGPESRKVKLKVYFQHSDGTTIEVAQTNSTKSPYESTLIHHVDSSWTLSMGAREIVRGVKDSLIEIVPMPFPIMKLFEDSRKNLWLGTVGHGIHQVVDGQFDKAKHFFGNYNTALTAEDKHGGLWIKSNEHEFAYMPNPNILRHSAMLGHFESDIVRELVTDSEKIFCLAGENQIAVIQGDSIKYLRAPLLLFDGQVTTNSYPTALYYDTINQQLCVGFLNRISTWDGQNWETIHLDQPRFSTSKVIGMEVHPDGTLYGTTRNDLFTIRDGKVDMVAPIGQRCRRISCIKIAPSGEIWLGTTSGIWIWKNQEFIRPVFNNKSAFIEKNIWEIAYASDRFWCLTEQNKLITIKDKTVKILKNEFGDDVILSGFYASENGEVWGRSFYDDMGLYRIHIENDIPVVDNYNYDDLALKYGSIPNTLILLKDVLYSGGLGGLFSTSLSTLVKDGCSPSVELIKVFIGRQRFPNQARYELEHHQNSLNLVFEPISFRTRRPNFQYRLLGLDSTWSVPETRALQFTNLEPGLYRFQVRARIAREPWGAMKETTFLIATPYWQTWWFRTLCIGVAILFIGWLFYLRFRAQRKRMALEIDKLKAEQRALRAQMNPHFMFNALSSIQDLVFNQDRVFAVNNIALFARLMRKILTHSAQEAISLEEEVETLTLYLKLEALRFEDRFEFDIHMDEGIDPNTRMIPPLFLQPFVENAIKHGLLNKEPAGGRLKVHFELQNDALLCSIEDDGVGRSYTSQNKAQRDLKHRSFGTQSVTERIQLINTQREKNITLQIIDLYADTLPVGTRIELLIP